MDLVDWPLAERIGQRLAPQGPTIPAAQAAEIVAQLRTLAVAARAPVAELTGLVAESGAADAVVVDRGEWVRSNIAAFALALDPMLTEKRDEVGGGPLAAIGARVTAAQLGGSLAWLSGKVLGQFEAFAPPGQAGRLLLVAPNIVTVERELELVPRDFRLWVCLHEETHRAQFGGVPWLADHFLSEVQAFVALADVPMSVLLRRSASVAQAVVTAARRQPGPSLVEAVQTPAQREVFDRLTGLMSLLEGQADVVMDEVGPAHVPTVAQIRARFDARRSSAGTVDGFARRMLGMDTKLRQYSAGASFVRTVLASAGREGFEQVWAAPENLPSAVEVEDPGAWQRRVLG